MDIYEIGIQKNDGTEVRLEDYKGKVILVVNSAIQCGFTPQYIDLKLFHEKYAKDGLVILDFPCNQFGKQSPGSDEEIQEFCINKYFLPYQLCKKVDVNGEHAHPLFTYLKNKVGFTGFQKEHELSSVLEEMLYKEDPEFSKSNDIKWNFTKFLISRNGEVIERFEPVDAMNTVENAIVKELRK